MVNNKRKFAYTLMEACVVMLVVSIIVAVMANVIPRKISPKTQSDVHGRYECYFDGDTLYQQTFIKGKSSTRSAVASCTFTPPDYVKFLIINAVGGAAPSGGSAGSFASTFYTTSNVKYKVELGAAGTGSNNGGDTNVLACTNTECTATQEVIKAKGGEYSANILNTNINDVKSCMAQAGPQILSSSVLSANYICDKSPICEIEGDNIKVSYCRTNEIYKTDYIPYKKYTSSTYKSEQQNMNDTNFIANSPYSTWNSATGVLTYYDASLWDEYGIVPSNDWNPVESTTMPSLYKLILNLKVNSNTTTSAMENYIKMLQIGSGISSVNPGSIKSGTSKPGAVVILW